MGSEKGTISSDLKITLLQFLMLIVALVLPFAYRIDIGPGPDSIRAMTWDYIESSWYSGFRLWNPFDALPYTLLRLVFAVMLGRYYQKDMPIWKPLLLGLLAEIQPIAISAPLVYLIDWPGDPHVPLYIPIPVFLILGTIFILIIKNRAHT
jgi:hypothetical protein